METLDEIDMKIIHASMNASRKSFSDIAKDIGISVSMVHRRVKKLSDKGIICNCVLLE